ncbi:serine/threonine-protein kinase HT1-like [Iris pallida]|uniref:Serine/threonine-protein kinase HT1-like n=1 Tax=Iris pallida TaxID=29817 RepID=A0AAX6HX91_IRIPA|nr:serine/threonine-protein kinase HT1-like [Iris pallida]
MVTTCEPFTMMEGTKFINDGDGGSGAAAASDYYDFGFYQKLGEGSNMSVDNTGAAAAAIASTAGGSVSMSVNNSSVGSNNNSHTDILHHPGLRTPVHPSDLLGPSPAATVGYRVFRSANKKRDRGGATSDDALAQALMDYAHPTESLRDYDEWTLNLRRPSMGAPSHKAPSGSSTGAPTTARTSPSSSSSAPRITPRGPSSWSSSSYKRS